MVSEDKLANVTFYGKNKSNLKLDQKSPDHEVIIGESDNSLAGEIKRIIKEKPWYKRLLVVLLTMERYEVTLCSP